MMPALLIGLSGKKRAGKNTVYMLTKLLLDEDETGIVRRVGFADALKKMAREKHHWNGQKDAVGRKLLQDLGLAMRAENPNYWVDKAVRKIRAIDNTGVASVIFVTDVRFENEAEAIHAMGGEVWRVVRPGLPSADAHVSETALDDYHFDYTIEAYTLDALFDGVKAGLSMHGLNEPKVM